MSGRLRECCGDAACAAALISLRVRSARLHGCGAAEREVIASGNLPLKILNRTSGAAHAERPMNDQPARGMRGVTNEVSPHAAVAPETCRYALLWVRGSRLACCFACGSGHRGHHGQPPAAAHFFLIALEDSCRRSQSGYNHSNCIYRQARQPACPISLPVRPRSCA
jgi:hypothetical protein